MGSAGDDVNIEDRSFIDRMANEGNDDNVISDTTSSELLYEVLNPSMFRSLVSGSDADVESVKKGDIVVYRIASRDFAHECIKAGFARVFIENQPKRISSPEELINRIVGVEKEIVGDDYAYVIKTIDGDIRITSDEIMSITAWKKKFVAINYMITFQGSNKTATDLSDVIMFLMAQAVVTIDERMTEDEMKANIFMETLRSLNIVMCDEDYVGHRNVLADDGVYAVSSKTVAGIMSELGWHHTSLNALGVILRDYKVGNNKQVRRCGQRVSEWRFKPWENE